MLGYSPANVSSLMNPGTAGIQKPQAYFTWLADAGVALQVNFDSTGSSCTNAPCSVSWNFGDGGTGADAQLSHIYAAPGDYPVTLIITDALRFSVSVTQTVTARGVNQPPTAAGLSTASGSNYTISFTDASTDPAQNNPRGITSDTVSWGDGSSSSGAVGSLFTHTYALNGTFPIVHTVVNAAGLNSSERLTVTVPQKFSIGGTVTHGGSGLAISGVTMILKLNGTTKATATTGSSGSYTFSNLLPGSYVVQPYKSGTVFTPATRTVVVGPNATGVDFIGTP